jgi:hypothetical protein
VAGTGTPSPEEYANEGHVEEAAIRDIAAFVTAPIPAEASSSSVRVPRRPP